MSNPFFEANGEFQPGTVARSVQMNDIFERIEKGFDLVHGALAGGGVFIEARSMTEEGVLPDEINAFIESCAAEGKIAVIDVEGDYPQIFVKNNSRIHIAKSIRLRNQTQTANNTTYYPTEGYIESLFWCQNVSNFSFTADPAVTLSAAGYGGTLQEHSHGFAIRMCSSFYIGPHKAAGFWGDGIYLNYVTDYLVDRPHAKDMGRNGISVLDSRPDGCHLIFAPYAENCQLNGLDIEPNGTVPLYVDIVNPVAYKCENGITVYLDAMKNVLYGDQQVYVNVSNPVCEDCGISYWMGRSLWDKAKTGRGKGRVIFDNPTSINARNADFYFDSVVNPDISFEFNHPVIRIDKAVTLTTGVFGAFKPDGSKKSYYGNRIVFTRNQTIWREDDIESCPVYFRDAVLDITSTQDFALLWPDSTERDTLAAIIFTRYSGLVSEMTFDRISLGQNPSRLFVMSEYFTTAQHRMRIGMVGVRPTKDVPAGYVSDVGDLFYMLRPLGNGTLKLPMIPPGSPMEVCIADVTIDLLGPTENSRINDGAIGTAVTMGKGIRIARIERIAPQIYEGAITGRERYFCDTQRQDGLSVDGGMMSGASGIGFPSSMTKQPFLLSSSKDAFSYQAGPAGFGTAATEGYAGSFANGAAVGRYWTDSIHANLAVKGDGRVGLVVAGSPRVSVRESKYDHALAPARGNDKTPLGLAHNQWREVMTTRGLYVAADDALYEQERALTEAEKTVALALKAAVKVSKLDSDVRDNAATAKWFVGWQAQAVIDAFAAQSLNALDYGMLRQVTWDEEPAVTDADGVSLIAAVPAGSAYMVNKEELLAFIVGAIAAA